MRPRRLDAVDVWRGASSAVHLHAIDAPHRSPRRLRIQAETGEVGKLSSAFGKGGKFRVQFEGSTEVQPGGRLYLVYKKYAFSQSKALHQDDDCVVPADELVTPGKPPKKKVVEPPPPPPLSPKKTEDVREGVLNG